MAYLTERLLGDVLGIVFPEHEFIHDRIVPNSGTRKRPDYRNDDLMLIVEFDGDKHYREVSKIKSEEEKTICYSNMGYRVVRIPYFVQITPETTRLLFDLEHDYTNDYPHGFIDEGAILPCDFNELGISKFLNDLNRFEIIRHQIIHSIREKIQANNNEIERVLPPSIQSLVD
ncbi:hypothetical protein [Siansivirga zeaxanthinifaciens]|uniref:DUF559 domain-containing protein n=1 Tax=Siansivirga zeaxanthinifaciens CC-SAMT-1 TaxID=1454006 RepID=A0A0C5WB52_9FLAO|nr:hypothetical protein [Siansivirga zeaxanthinifaciens]AJR03562.1 hypothetical protein AW14_07905 [Siansivirga zeaxanthinifaciens CC-SAMT-1]